MAVQIKPVTLWRVEVPNEPGVLARTLEPLASARADLQVVMGYRFSGDRSRGAIEVAPVSGARATKAAGAAGLSQSGIPALRIEGDNRVGLGHAIASALAEAGINIDFVVAQVSGGRYSAIFGFDNEEALRRAAPILRRVARVAAPIAGRKSAARKSRKATRKRARR
ncbi:MAG: hypothetical protein AUI33_15110 [Ignavibacteria bacterium 13_1_40CM_2_61_4]|nr:MAG: hypothetical protein AUI33_15110 [Ignavibacteria bacterium 13_1_40CM_2_61_4]